MTHSKDEVSQSDAYSHSLIRVSFLKQAACGGNIPVNECQKIVVTVHGDRCIFNFGCSFFFILHSNNLLNPTNSAYS